MAITVTEKGLMQVKQADPMSPGPSLEIVFGTSAPCHGNFKLTVTTNLDTASAQCSFSGNAGDVTGITFVNSGNPSTPTTIQELDNPSGCVLSKKFVVTINSTTYAKVQAGDIAGDLKVAFVVAGSVSELQIGGARVIFSGNGSAVVSGIPVFAYSSDM